MPRARRGCGGVLLRWPRLQGYRRYPASLRISGSPSSACGSSAGVGSGDSTRSRSSASPSVTASSALRSSPSIRRMSRSRRSLSAIASRRTDRASACASVTISSASRRACSLTSCAARSAETSVDRSRVSSSTWRADLLLELLDPVGEVGALAPDGLEAVGDLGQRMLHDRALVAEEPTLELEVADLDGGDGHRSSSAYNRRSMSVSRTLWMTNRVITATIGEMSIGPSGGRIRRKIRR